MRENLPFFSDCVDWKTDLLAALEYLVDEGEDITRETFFRHVGRDNVLRAVGEQWFPHRRYYGHDFRRLRGFEVYWFTHSAIEFVFAHEQEILAVQDRAMSEAYERALVFGRAT